MKIIVNGREFEGVEQMPLDVRRQYREMMGSLGEDSDGDGVPDVLQQPGSSNVVVKKSITYNGKEYQSEEDLPPDVRELLAHVPKLKPGESRSDVEIETAQLIEHGISFGARWPEHRERLTTGVTVKLSWFLVLLLLGAVFVLLYLWLSGIKPADLRR